jgi:hypothetical protein
MVEIVDTPENHQISSDHPQADLAADPSSTSDVSSQSSPLIIPSQSSLSTPSSEEIAAIPAASSRPKIAVYVTGGKDVAENKALGTYILEALVRSQRYVAIERADVFLAEVDNEHIAQRSGAVDDAQISQLGKRSGVQFVCVADITYALRGAQVSARVLDVETAEVAALGSVEGRLRTMEDLRRVSAEVVGVMLGVMPPRERRVSFAVRAAYGNSYVSKYSAPYWNFEITGGTLGRPEERWNKVGAGSGFEAGASAIIGLAYGFSVEVGTSYVWRRPITIDGLYNVSESAVVAPVLLRGLLAKEVPFYLQGGVQLEVPVNTVVEKDIGGVGELGERASVDAGLLVGAGYRVRKDMAVDVRAVHGLRSFDGQVDRLMYQVSVGVSYIY